MTYDVIRADRLPVECNNSGASHVDCELILLQDNLCVLYCEEQDNMLLLMMYGMKIILLR